MNKIITVAREFGSGGRAFARALAQELGYDYYDKEILTEITKHTAFSEEYVKSIVDKNPHTLFPISIGHSFSNVMDYQIQQMKSVFTAQFDAITALADKSDCVIVGRCADYILRDRNPYRIFVYSDINAKVARCLEFRREGEPEDAAGMEKLIKKLDKDRAKYYNAYTGQNWGEKEYFDLCLNTCKFDVAELAGHVAAMLR